MNNSPAGRPAWPAGILMCLLLHQAIAGAETQAVSVPARLTLADALRATAQHNPELRGQSFDLLANDGRRLQAGLRPNPEVELEVENVPDDTEITLALSQVIELGGKRQLRGALAGRELELLQIGHHVRRLDILAETARRFIRVAAGQELLDVARRSEELAEKRFQAIARRVEAGRAPFAERSRAAAALTRARMERESAERHLRSARHSLAAMWGSAEAGFLTAQADLLRLPQVGQLESLMASVADNPDIAQYLSRRRLLEAELILARAQRRPDVRLGAGVRRFEETGDHALVFSVSVPWPAFDRNQGAIQETSARLNKTELERQAALVEAQARLFELYQELEQAGQDVRTLREELLPQARKALEETESGYERGRFSWLEVAEAQNDLIEAERRLVETAADYHLLIAEIERLTGTALIPTGDPS